MLQMDFCQKGNLAIIFFSECSDVPQMDFCQKWNVTIIFVLNVLSNIVSDQSTEKVNDLSWQMFYSHVTIMFKQTAFRKTFKMCCEISLQVIFLSCNV